MITPHLTTPDVIAEVEEEIKRSLSNDRVRESEIPRLACGANE
jgi:hypothetical protein